MTTKTLVKSKFKLLPKMCVRSRTNCSHLARVAKLRAAWSCKLVTEIKPHHCWWWKLISLIRCDCNIKKIYSNHWSNYMCKQVSYHENHIHISGNKILQNGTRVDVGTHYLSSRNRDTLKKHRLIKIRNEKARNMLETRNKCLKAKYYIILGRN